MKNIQSNNGHDLLPTLKMNKSFSSRKSVSWKHPNHPSLHPRIHPERTHDKEVEITPVRLLHKSASSVTITTVKADIWQPMVHQTPKSFNTTRASSSLNSVQPIDSPYSKPKGTVISVYTLVPTSTVVITTKANVKECLLAHIHHTNNQHFANMF